MLKKIKEKSKDRDDKGDNQRDAVLENSHLFASGKFHVKTALEFFIFLPIAQRCDFLSVFLLPHNAHI